MKRLVSLLISLLLLCGLAMPITAAFAASPNLIANPSVETANGTNPANWTADSWGTNSTTMTYASTGHTGSRSLSIATTAYTNGDAKWIPDPVAITPGQSYTYSEYYISNVATEIDAEYTNASGAVSYSYLESVPASSIWTQTQFNFVAPATATQISVLDILFSVGTLQTDDFSLTLNTPVVAPPNTDGNLVANPSMETANGTSPVDWQSGGWGTNTTAFTYNTNSGHTGTHSATVKTSSYTNGDAKWYFNPVAVTAGATYNFSDYYESTVATDVMAVFMTSTGTTTYKDLGAAPANSAAWKQYTASLLIPAGISTMTVYHLISAIGTLQVDDYSLTTAPVPAGVSITAPAASATVSGIVTVSASAVDSVGVKSVQFELDGKTLGTPVTASPYQTAWNTATTTFGVHSLSAIETNTAGKTTTSAAVSVTVNNISATGNQIPNPGLETVNPSSTTSPLDWNTSTWGTNKTTFSYPSTGHSGQRSVKTQITSYTSGASYWYNNDIPLTGGQMYDFQDYYESNTLNEIDAAVTMSDGTIDYVYVGEGYPSPNSWTHFEAQFTAPVGSVSVNFEHNIYSVGWLTTDDYNLTPFTYQGFSRPIISITDDDSYASFYNNGLPILQKYGLTSTDYIITSYINNVSGYMTSPMVKGLYTAGEEIGSHSVDHPDLTTLTAAQQDAELKNSQTWLQTLLPGVPITDYAAPYGSYNQQLTTDAAKYYKSYRSTDPGYNAKNNFDPSHLMVQNLDSTVTTATVQSWIAEAQATNTWLILVYHQVDPSTAAGLYNTYPSDFDAQMSAIKSSGIAVETISQALQEVEAQE